MTGFSFYRCSPYRYCGLSSCYKAVITRDANTGRRHIKIFDRSSFDKPLLYTGVSISTQNAKKICNEFLAKNKNFNQLGIKNGN